MIAGLAVGAALTGASLSPLTWYLARASGFTLYLLLWFTVVSGLGMTTKLAVPSGRAGESWIIHRFTTELSFIALAMHLLSLALDPSVALGVLGVLVPFTSDVRQPWTDLGIVAAWGMIALTLSYGVRHYTGKHGWRILHYAAFPLWVIALLHGIGAGSDSRQFWAIGVYLLTSASVIFLSTYRLLRIGRRGAGATQHPEFIHDRRIMHRKIASYRHRCASLSSKTNRNSQT
jgi:hypothetical protein